MWRKEKNLIILEKLKIFSFKLTIQLSPVLGPFPSQSSSPVLSHPIPSHRNLIFGITWDPTQSKWGLPILIYPSYILCNGLYIMSSTDKKYDVTSVTLFSEIGKLLYLSSPAPIYFNDWIYLWYHHPVGSYHVYFFQKE